MEEAKILRINELAAKEKLGTPLTKEEKEEQTALRREYIDAVKNNLRAQLGNIKRKKD